jgi:DNA-binding transcriptional MerR regulator
VSKGPEAFRTISEVAEELDLPQHVLRFWETRFGQIRPMKRGGGRRYYRPDDVELLRGIRQLLYGEGYTIKGVQRILREQGARAVIGVGHGERLPAMAPLAADERGDEPDLEAAEPAFESAGAEPIPDEEDVGDLPQPEPPRRGFMGRLRPESAAAGQGAPALAKEDVRKLQATLIELLECKRLLDQTR